MAVAVFTCSQCLYTATLDSSIKFCPRCGLAIDDSEEANDPVSLKISTGSVVVRNLLSHGDLCNLYICDCPGRKGRGVFKIARSHRANPHVRREAETLRRLHEADHDRRFAPFLPYPVESVLYHLPGGQQGRLANMLGYFDGIEGPSGLFSLVDVQAAHPSGIDARDMAWMWRRLLTVLGFTHAQGIAHCAVTPDHVLIEPRDHKLILVGWSASAPFGTPPHLAPLRWREWSRAVNGGNMVASPTNDLACAARSMSGLLSTGAEPAVLRHLQRAESGSDAWALLEDFDRLIEAMWGPRQFRPFLMPDVGTRKE